MKFILPFFDHPFWALVRKEINQILRNKQLIILLIVPPTVQLLLYGFALNPDVQNLKLGVIDYAHVADSRELISAMTSNRIFTLESVPNSEKDLSQQVEKGKLNVGVIIPPEFPRKLAQKSAEIQVFIDAVNANTAGIAANYMNQIVQQYNLSLEPGKRSPPVSSQVVFLYNPGLISSWFFVPGVMGLVLTLIGTLVSAVTVVREKDTGTLEQLLMTPAANWQILLSKIVPLVFLLMGDVMLALTLGTVVFNLPFQGSFLLFISLSSMYVFVGISLGIMLATICRSQQQVLLTSFFINLPIVQTSGAIAPIEAMPTFFQVLSLLNPLRHYITIVRGILLKGVGLDVLWIHVLALLGFAVVLLSISVSKFRNQLS
ncbi:ABC transporter permease [Anabaena sp. FACHB-1250]|uniref:Transport permease protein n=1 Tax=Dolichospermum planctonicum TaxID=136072 RepID=A0A480AIZ5_9CYAN|nr:MULTISPECIES: ABC transporter permease [Nostocales]MBD2141875.1 ABC transporter permease [Anabaena sp. FACHB-1250]GCL43278.1 ABC-2 type transporter [Dolichospermum planctonicum]